MPVSLLEALHTCTLNSGNSPACPQEHNPRIDDQAVDAVANLIREFGLRQPIVVDSDDMIIAGHDQSSGLRYFTP